MVLFRISADEIWKSAVDDRCSPRFSLQSLKYWSPMQRPLVDGGGRYGFAFADRDAQLFLFSSHN